MEAEKSTLESRFEEEIKNHQEKKRKARKRRVMKVVAVVLLIVGVCVYVVEEWRVGVINFFENIEYAIRAPIEQKREEAFMKKQLEGDPIKSYSAGNITMNYIPEGYRLVEDSSETNKSVTLYFENADGKSITFRVKKVVSNGVTTIDTEDAVVTEFEYRGYKAIKSIKDRVQILIWYDDEMKYSLNCEINEEELMKIADNIDF